jgi:hypothetical protein
MFIEQYVKYKINSFHFLQCYNQKSEKKIIQNLKGKRKSCYKIYRKKRMLRIHTQHPFSEYQKVKLIIKLIEVEGQYPLKRWPTILLDSHQFY